MGEPEPEMIKSPNEPEMVKESAVLAASGGLARTRSAMLIALADEIRDDLFDDEEDDYSDDEEFNEAANPEEKSIK